MSRKANESKQRIRLIALDLMKKKGYDSVTINDICNAANIAKNTFYYYFKSKEDLLAQFNIIPTDVMAEHLTSILIEETSIEKYWKSLEPVLDSIVDQGPEITKHMFYALTKQGIQTFSSSKFYQNITNVLVTIIGQAQASGEIRNTSDPALLFVATSTQLLGVISAWCTTNGNFDLKDAYRLTIEVCFDVKPELRKAPADALSGMNIG